MPIGNAAWGDIIADTDRDMTSDLNGSIVGTTCWRTDVDPLNGGTLYVCTALPPTKVANWSPWSAAGGVGTNDATQTFYFSAAGTYLIAAGPSTAYSMFLTDSVDGTVRIYDNLSAAGPDVLGSTVTAVATNVSIPIGTPPTYGAANTGLCLVVTGANVGYVTWGE